MTRLATFLLSGIACISVLPTVGFRGAVGEAPGSPTQRASTDPRTPRTTGQHAEVPAAGISGARDLTVELVVRFPEADEFGLRLVGRATADQAFRFEVVYAGRSGLMSTSRDIRLDLDGVRQVVAKIKTLRELEPGLSARVPGTDGVELSLERLPAEPATEDQPAVPSRFVIRRSAGGAMFATDNSFTVDPDKWSALANALPDVIHRASVMARDSAAKTLEAR
jgi:hypothetical protein